MEIFYNDPDWREVNKELQLETGLIYFSSDVGTQAGFNCDFGGRLFTFDWDGDWFKCEWTTALPEPVSKVSLLTSSQGCQDCQLLINIYNPEVIIDKIDSQY